MIRPFLVLFGILFSLLEAAECNINQSPIQVAYLAYIRYSKARGQVGVLRRINFASGSPDYRTYYSEEQKLSPIEKKRLTQMITDYEKSLK